MVARRAQYSAIFGGGNFLLAYLITHFFPGGSEQQYQTTIAAAHPQDGLPAGQTFHAAGPTEGGWLVAALWDSKEACDSFMTDTLVPALANTEGALQGPPEARVCEVANLLS